MNHITLQGIEIGEPDSIGEDGQPESYNVRAVCARCEIAGVWTVIGRSVAAHWRQACPVGWLRVMNADQPVAERIGGTNPLCCPDCAGAA